ERMAGDLDREIKSEQERAGIHDPAHFAYPTYAKAAMARKDNLNRSADELKVQLDDAKAALGEAFEELKKVELLDERDQARHRADENARGETDLDTSGVLRGRGARASRSRRWRVPSPRSSPLPLSQFLTPRPAAPPRAPAGGLDAGPGSVDNRRVEAGRPTGC